MPALRSQIAEMIRDPATSWTFGRGTSAADLQLRDTIGRTGRCATLAIAE